MTSVSMNGYLPSQNGVEPLEQSLIAQFERLNTAGEDGPVQIVVVGLMDVASVRHRANPKANPPILTVRLSALEVAEGRRADTLRLVLAGLKSAREGSQPLDGIDEALMELLEEEAERHNQLGSSTASRDPKSGPLSKPAPPATFSGQGQLEGDDDDTAGGSSS